MTWESPALLPRAGTQGERRLRVCAATQAPSEASWVTHGLVRHVPVNFPTHGAPSLFLFFIRPQVWIPCLSNDRGFFLSLEWHDFLRAWSLGVSSGFIFGISFFVLPGECNQISFICLILARLRTVSSWCRLVFYLMHSWHEKWQTWLLFVASLFCRWVHMKAQLCVGGVVGWVQAGEAANCHFWLLRGRKEAPASVYEN